MSATKNQGPTMNWAAAALVVGGLWLVKKGYDRMQLKKQLQADPATAALADDAVIAKALPILSMKSTKQALAELIASQSVAIVPFSPSASASAPMIIDVESTYTTQSPAAPEPIATAQQSQVEPAPSEGIPSSFPSMAPEVATTEPVLDTLTLDSEAHAYLYSGAPTEVFGSAEVIDFDSWARKFPAAGG